MSANIAVVSPPEETTSVVTRNRIVCFVNDELSAAALRKGLEGSNLEVKQWHDPQCHTDARNRHRAIRVGGRHQWDR